MKVVSNLRRRSLQAACASVRVPSPVFIEQVERRILLANPSDPQLNPLSAVPALNSLPSASAKIYLDFNGHPAINDWLGLPVPATPAFDRDGDPFTFTNGELEFIREVWGRVAEKFSPFNINVTTVDPGNQTNQVTAVMVIGGEAAAWLAPGIWGVAPLGGFYNAAPNVAFTFSADGPQTPTEVAEVTAHELGHLFGLEHQSLWNGEELVDEYRLGNPRVGPIMGHGLFSSERTTWTIGTSAVGPDVFQNDLAMLSNSANGFGYRPDDYGNSTGSATTLTGVNGTVSAKGVLHTVNDEDFFKFTVPAGRLSLTVIPYTRGGMLDASMDLLDSNGNLIAARNSLALSESINEIVEAGTYYVRVYSHGASPAGEPGDVGQYELRGQLPVGVVTSEEAILQVSGTDSHDVITIDLVDGQYRLDVNGVIEMIDPASVSQFSILAGDGDDVVTIGPGVCKVYILGGAGNDTLTGGDFNDTITGSAGKDVIYGNGGDDRLAGSGGHDILVGGEGNDRLYGDDGNDVLTGGSGVDRIWGGFGHDVLAGNAGNDKLYGEDGNDSLYGGAGNDLLDGGVGLDYLYGQNGDDTLYARDGAFDYVSGGAGFDKAETEVFDQKDSLEELLA